MWCRKGSGFLFELVNLKHGTYNIKHKMSETMYMGHAIRQRSQETFHDILKRCIDDYILLAYASTKKYPTDERYGLTSQDRRAALSIMLNYVEGYARMRPAVQLNQYEIAYASLKESIYCRFLAVRLNYISLEEYREANALKERIGAMLYSSIEGLRRKVGE